MHFGSEFIRGGFYAGLVGRLQFVKAAITALMAAAAAMGIAPGMAIVSMGRLMAANAASAAACQVRQFSMRTDWPLESSASAAAAPN